MKKNRLFIIIGLIILLIGWKNYIPKGSILGKYINNNTEATLEGPSPIKYGIDTLKLLENDIFESKTWGNGTYKVSKNFPNTEIHLRYDAYPMMGEAEFSTQIEKSIFGKIKIWLDYDLGFYFEKID